MPASLGFTVDTVHAVLDGRKVQTRRVLKPVDPDKASINLDGFYTRLPYKVGDEIVATEPWFGKRDDEGRIVFKGYVADRLDAVDGAFRSPARFMPHAFARFTLTVREVRVERLQNITLSDIFAEGIDYSRGGLGDEIRAVFAGFWDDMHTDAEKRWGANPRVAALTFTYAVHPCSRGAAHERG